MSEPRFAIVVSRFNETVTGRLLAGAEACFADRGFQDSQVSVYFVPGAWELPVAVLHAARAGFAGVVAIGCVVRGDTPHFDYVAGGAADGLARVSVETGVPIAFGVLTTETMEQALDRAGGKHGNKGYEAAETVLEMVDLIGRIEEERASTQ
jgi:6,7-dimethyl-8-ribityllumazine synthase